MPNATFRSSFDSCGRSGTSEKLPGPHRNVREEPEQSAVESRQGTSRALGKLHKERVVRRMDGRYRSHESALPEMIGRDRK